MTSFPFFLFNQSINRSNSGNCVVCTRKRYFRNIFRSFFRFLSSFSLNFMVFITNSFHFHSTCGAKNRICEGPLTRPGPHRTRRKAWNAHPSTRPRRNFTGSHMNSFKWRKKRTLMVRGDRLVDRGQQYFFEKIRPGSRDAPKNRPPPPPPPPVLQWYKNVFREPFHCPCGCKVFWALPRQHGAQLAALILNGSGGLSFRIWFCFRCKLLFLRYSIFFLLRHFPLPLFLGGIFVFCQVSNRNFQLTHFSICNCWMFRRYLFLFLFLTFHIFNLTLEFEKRLWNLKKDFGIGIWKRLLEFEKETWNLELKKEMKWNRWHFVLASNWVTLVFSFTIGKDKNDEEGDRMWHTPNRHHCVMQCTLLNEKFSAKHLTSPAGVNDGKISGHRRNDFGDVSSWPFYPRQMCLCIRARTCRRTRPNTKHSAKRITGAAWRHENPTFSDSSSQTAASLFMAQNKRKTHHKLTSHRIEPAQDRSWCRFCRWLLSKRAATSAETHCTCSTGPDRTVEFVVAPNFKHIQCMSPYRNTPNSPCEKCQSQTWQSIFAARAVYYCIPVHERTTQSYKYVLPIK